MYNFSLHPFLLSEECSAISLHGGVRRYQNTISIWFNLAGADFFNLPSNREHPCLRQRELWKKSCFELFFARPGSPMYWEVNIAPEGHWDMYRFHEYRQGMVREERVQMPSSRILLENGSFTLHSHLCLDNLGLENYPLAMGISSVLRHKTDELSYWALTHNKTQADFHDRSTFTLIV